MTYNSLDRGGQVMLRLHSLVWVLIIVTYLGIICFRCYQGKMFGARAIQRRRDKEAELKVGDKTSHACGRVTERIAMGRTNKIARAAALQSVLYQEINWQ